MRTRMIVRPDRLRTNHGFTLLELLVTMAVASVLLLVLAALS